MGDLIDVVADGRQRPQQRRVFVGRPLPKLHPGDSLSDQYAGRQARDLALLSQVGVFLIVQPKADKVIAFSHNTSMKKGNLSHGETSFRLMAIRL